MKKLITLSIIATALSLQGCIFVAGAAAGAAAIAAVNDQRTVSMVLKDKNIANTAADKINASPALRDDCHIEISSFNQVVLLTGQAPSAELAQQAEESVKSIPDVTRTYNQITVGSPTSTLTRANDSWISTKIKTQMLATEDLKSSSMKVITENGTVYLMGTVTHGQADIAANIARQVSGVQKVVKIFQYKD